jgi:hypothetical protein
MKCSRTARGSEFGNGMASAAEASPQQSGPGKSKARVPPEFEYSKFSLNLPMGGKVHVCWKRREREGRKKKKGNPQFNLRARFDGWVFRPE